MKDETTTKHPMKTVGGTLKLGIKFENFKKTNLYGSLIAILFIAIHVTSCSSDNDDHSVEIPNTLHLKVDETYELGAVSKNWYSTNDFVATVNEAGMITARKVGNTTIKDNLRQCKVYVEPTITLYDEPIMKWGISKTELTQLRGNNYKKSGNFYFYETNLQLAPIEGYYFENNQLKYSVMMVSSIATEILIDHLSERYEPVTVDLEKYTVYFVDNYKTSHIKNAIVAQLSDDSACWMVMYFPFTAQKSISENEIPDSVRSEMNRLMEAWHSMRNITCCSL